jgi:hypothetical protein
MATELEIGRMLLLAAGRRQRITVTVDAGVLYDAITTLRRMTGADVVEQAGWRSSARQLENAAAEALLAGREPDDSHG